MSVDSAENKTAAVSREMALRDFLHEAMAGRRAHYVPNHGNAGDSLIALGTLDFFRKHEIPYSLCTNPDAVRNSLVIYGGGGALVGLYGQTEALIGRLAQNRNHVIILPHTIRNVKGDLQELGGSIDLICREEISYRYALGLSCFHSVTISDDMALYSSSIKTVTGGSWTGAFITALLRKANTRQRARMAKNFARAVRTYLKCRDLALTSTTLNCFRTDVEKAGSYFPNENLDLSKSYMLGADSLGGIELSCRFFLRSLQMFSVINTDRLHCCIGGLLLGKKVNFYGNSYYKNEAVYDYSIRDRTSLVTWAGTKDTAQPKEGA